ncbi:hypothetical protein Ahy_B03g062831 isoform A [Arachis hypogaea]|uniref:Uncharacterized protein n=1 Tax=Arachis hypogaea TaxID=3818 RepID=A0A444ZVL2_ARAHY|nr:hypothetical protein Ahy_B03g062831 isoform A [Arachis hypogaea]
MVSARDNEFAEGFRLQEIYEVMLGLKELKSDGNATKMARALVMDYVKHGIVFAVDGYKEYNGVKITSIDLDYVPDEGKDSGLIEVEVDVESEPSTEENRFEDNTDDGEHENYFGFDVEDGVDGGESNAFDGFNGPLYQERTTEKVAENNQASGVMDEQVKDIFYVFVEMVLSVEYRLYLRHLYANCKKAYGGGTILRYLILSIAKATYVKE